MTVDNRNPNNEWLWIILVIAGIFTVFGLGQALMRDDPPNNEPYTGVCLEPTPQLGC